MKYFFILFGLILTVSCKSNPVLSIQTAVLESDCPKTGTCEIKIVSGKSINFNDDALNRSYSLIDDLSKKVVIYKYDKMVKGNIQDANYREEVIFELDANKLPIELSDAQLQNAKMLFGRFCYCKGQTGYYQVTKGRLIIDHDYNASLNFSISEVPQIIDQIRFSLK